MEKSDVFNKIDTLVAMARSKNVAEDLVLELDTLEKKIQASKVKLLDLNESMTEDKYFDASSEIVDRNIEIGLTKKIKKLKLKVKELASKLEEQNAKSNLLTVDRDNTAKQVADLEESISATRNRITENGEATMLEHYNQKITSLEASKGQLEESLKAMTVQVDNLQLEIGKLTEELNKNQAQIEANEQQLTEVRQSLEEGTAYLDIALKTRDEERKAELADEIDKATKRIKAIDEDPVMLGKDAKELLLADDVTGALTKIRILAGVVKKIPFMDLPNDENLQTILTGELARAEAARDEFATIISNKDYTMKESNIENNRISYLNKRIAKDDEQINYLKERIADVDSDRVFEIDKEIENAILEINQMNADFQRIQNLVNAETGITRKASLKTMAESKNDDLKRANGILSSYRNEQAKDIIMAGNIQSTEITRLANQIEAAKTEIKEIESRKLLSSTKSHDIISEEADKSDLAVKAQLVMDIKHRQTYLASPDEVLKMIESNLGTVINPTANQEVQAVVEPEPNIIQAATEPEPIIDQAVAEPIQVEKAIEPVVTPIEVAPIAQVQSLPTAEPVTEKLPIVEVAPAIEEIVPVIELEKVPEPVVIKNEEVVTTPEVAVATPTETIINQDNLSAQSITELPPITDTSLDNLNDLFASNNDVVPIVETVVEQAPTVGIKVPDVNEAPIDLLEEVVTPLPTTPEAINNSDNQMATRIKVVDVSDVKPVTTATAPSAEVFEEEVPAFERSSIPTTNLPNQSAITAEVKDNVFDFPEQFFGTETLDDTKNIDEFLNFKVDSSAEKLTLGKAA